MTAVLRLPGLAPAVLLLAAAKLALHLATTGTFGYGFFVDELYFLALAEHLDWGYVDLPPLFPALTALVRGVLGDSLLAVRLTPAFAGAALVVLTGLLARELGGGRFAQGLAGLLVLTAPLFLVTHGLHTMNALEPLVWTGAALLLARWQKSGNDRAWLWFGLLAGIGLLNKHSTGVFGAAVVAALLLGPERRTFARPGIWLGGLAALAVFLPNLVWLAWNRFPHLEHLAQVRADGRDVDLSPLAFLTQQVLLMNPIAFPVWLGGLVFLLVHPEGKEHRLLGLVWLGVVSLFLAAHGRVYYPAPAYPVLFAAGGVALERAASRAGWTWLRVAVPACLAIAGAVLAPLVLPCLPPALAIRYSRALGVEQPRIENHRLGPLPQLFADRFGWPEMAAEVARVYHSLPEADRRKAAIFGQNYGQAGALDLFGPALGLPKALSGHLTYHRWGPRGFTGEVVIVLDDDRETLERHFERVERGGHVSHPLSMPYQHFDVWVCRGMRAPLAEVWPKLRKLG